MQLKSLCVCALALAWALPLSAQQSRDLGAHQHGHGDLNIAIAGARIAIELEVPGFDIVGFEHAAETAEDIAKVEAALARLAEPMALFVLPEAAGCTVIEAMVDPHGPAGDHDDHEHDDHDDQDTPGGEDAHSEFHARYLLICDDISAATLLEMPYFATFENAKELEVQLVTDSGAALLHASWTATVLDLTKAR